jgi:hypothetical protein
MELVKLIVTHDLFVILYRLQSLLSSPIAGACHLHYDSNGGLTNLGDDPLAFLDFHQLSEIPGKLLSHIIVIGHIVNIDKLVLKDCIQDKVIKNHGVTSHVKVIVGAVTKVEAGFIP